MYYGNKAKVHIPNWWEIRKMCKGLERLKPQVSVMLEYAGSFDGVPKGKRYLDLSANEDGINIEPHYFGSDYKKMPPQEAAKRITWNRIRDRGYKPADQPDETLAHLIGRISTALVTTSPPMPASPMSPLPSESPPLE